MGLAPARVVMMVDSLLAGGAERLAVELACALDRDRFSPHMLVTRGTGPLRELLERADVPVTVLDRRRRVDVRAWRRAHELVSDADLLHTHKYGSNVWGALLARTADKPFIAHEHNFSSEASRVRTILDRTWISPRAARIICVSESVADVERSIGIEEHQLVVVPNGVRLESALSREQARAELGLVDHDEFVVGIVGRLRPEKAHQHALAALAQLQQHGGGRRVRLCVVGDGPRAAELNGLAASLGVSRTVTWAGERRDAARLASAFDAGLICSDWEGMPLAALETMAAGVPLIATAVGALPDLLGNGCGLLVAPADPAGIAMAVRQLADDPARAAATGAAGRSRVRDNYTFSRMVRRIEGIYTAVLEEAAIAGIGSPSADRGGARKEAAA
jgi:glycosyltransferase involved in cell wall biosynthesis